ncbi:hypothetical protein A0H81_08401 [Grifola frondosa]|uniref:BTB domain-containing protein n=1 Tax=Grifola frondosa TaxID=5627 RepID=A0A1C7M395_GRIFR|nr:hypothetical protein A0H81_08401 [Grifola frondosa]
MFELPSPSHLDIETVDDCQVVRMYDLPVELSNLIKALYDGASFHNRSVADFYYVAGILRLSTKYFITHLRKQAIRHLSQTWPHSLRGHDHMVENAVKAPPVDGLSYPYVHPLHVLNLARETNVRIIVPSALYFLSLYPLSDLLQGDHPKLQIEHPSRPSLPDRCDAGLRPSYMRWRSPNVSCQNEDNICNKAFTRLANRLARSWVPRTGPIHWMVQAMDELSNDPNVCGPCRRAFRQDVTALREKVWSELPGVVGLTDWKNLEAADMDI